MSAIGQPDYQRGVASAQLLLASPAAGASVVTVGVPPNAETIVVMIQGGVGVNVVSCVGVTTGIGYIGALAVGSTEVPAWTTIFFDVAQAVDKQVQIKITTPPAAKWYVYADAATHISVDPTKASNNIGQQYVVPAAPSVLAGDHPPVELKYWTAGGGNGTNVLPAPAAGTRYRIFTAQCGSFSAAANVNLEDNTGVTFFQGSSGFPSSFGQFPLTGLPLPTGSPVILIISGGATCNVTLSFTTETV